MNNVDRTEMVDRALDIYPVSRVATIGNGILAAQGSLMTTNEAVIENDEEEHVWQFAKFLLITTDQSQELVFAPGTYAIGRLCDIFWLSEDIQISRIHAILTIHADGRMTIRDVESKNGTFVNDKKLEPGHRQELYPNDLVQIGQQQLLVKCGYRQIS